MRSAIALLFALLPWSSTAQVASKPVVLVVTADAGDYILAAGGTIAGLIDKGAAAYVIRVTNDENDAWELTPEEAARRTRAESEEAGRILGATEVISMGFRAAQLADVPFTTLRDRLIVYIRHFQPGILFIPNPYTEYDRVLDRFYAGRAAEDAWRAAAFENYIPPFQRFGLKPHLTAELYYYSQPYDPRRREPESTATFVPEPKVVDISGTFGRKIKAAQTLKTINHSMALRLRERLAATGRKLALLDQVNDRTVNALGEENVRGLSKIAAQGTSYSMAEEFRYAGLSYRIPSSYLK